MKRFKKEVLQKIKTDIELFSIVCKALDVSPLSMNETIRRNGNNLNNFSIVKLVAGYLKSNPEDLVEDTES